MAKNKVQFQVGYSLFEFIKDYGTEEQCHQALFKWRWPTGFVCPECVVRNTVFLKLDGYTNAIDVIIKRQEPVKRFLSKLNSH